MRRCSSCWTLRFLFSAWFLAESTASAMHVLSVEPYLAEWCAAQFPDQLKDSVTGHAMAELIRDRSYVRVEPYLGSYCFDVLGSTELKGQKREETLKKMNQKHVQIEPYLMEWGQKAMLSPSDGGGGLSAPNVETYVAEWCVKGQFHRLMPNPTKSLQDVGRYPVKVEVALGPWCFAQFPNEMASLDEDFYIKRLQTDHVHVEDFLMKWEIANFHVREDPKNQSGSSDGAMNFVWVILVCGVGLLGLGWIHAQHPKAIEAAQERIQQLLTPVLQRDDVAVPLTAY